MQQISYNEGELIKSLDNLNPEKEVDEYFLENRDDIGLIDTDNYKNIIKDLNQVYYQVWKKEWDLVFNLIKKKVVIN